MKSYAFWNNKGGIGKSFLCFVAASEYAHKFPNSDVYVIDLCPQANVSESLLSTSATDSALSDIIEAKPRKTVGGYLEARLNSPFRMIDDAEKYIVKPIDFNSNIPSNLYLITGDNLVEIFAEAIRQTSQLSIPVDSWAQVQNWIRDLTVFLSQRSGERDSVIMIDCNPSFSIYTQLGLVAADDIIVPFTPDESSHRAVKNLVALLYGKGVEDSKINAYARINFAKRAIAEGLTIPKLHTFISNRVTIYDGKESKAFKGISKVIKSTVDKLHDDYRSIFSNSGETPSDGFIFIPDYHSACVISSTMGIPFFKMKSGPKKFRGERVQLNKEPLERYKQTLENFVNRL